MEQLESLCSLQSHIFRLQTYSKHQDLILACVMAASMSRELVEKDESQVWAAMLKHHGFELNFLRSQVPVELILERLDQMEHAEELEARKSILYLENKVIGEVCQQADNGLKLALQQAAAEFGHDASPEIWSRFMMAPRLDLMKDSSLRQLTLDAHQRSRLAKPTVRDPRYATLLRNAERLQPSVPKVKPPKSCGCVENGGHAVAARAESTVNISSGCPFIHTKDCPFREASWVNPLSYRCQHVQRRYTPIKPISAISAKDDSYGSIAEHQEDLARNVRSNLYMAEGRGMMKKPLDARFTEEYLRVRPLSAASRLHHDETGALSAARNSSNDARL